MTAIVKTGIPTVVSQLIDGHNNVGTGYLCGEDIAAGDACTLVPDSAAAAAGVPAMLVMQATAAADNPSAIALGFAARSGKVAQADAVTLVKDVDFRYGSGFAALFLASGPALVYLSATVPGGLDTAPAWAGQQPIGAILDDQRIRLWGSNAYLDSGTPAAGTIQSKTVVVALGTGAGAGGAFSWQNPEATPILIERVVVDLKTVATAACTLDIGTTTVNGTTLSDNILDGIDVHSAIGQFDNLLAANAGTNGLTVQKLAAAKWLTGSQASGAIAGEVGNVYITYLVVAN